MTNAIMHPLQKPLKKRPGNNNSEIDATAINRCIRELLNLFGQNTLVHSYAVC